MQSSGDLSSLKQKSSFHQLEVAGPYHSILNKFLKNLYPQESIWWNAQPLIENIDTYVLFYSCPYGIEEKTLLKDGIQRAQELLKNDFFQPTTSILIVLYRDLKVAFPERKLQREKVMSEMVTEDVLRQYAFNEKNRIKVTHEFGSYQLQDTLQHLLGFYLFFEVKSYG